MQPLERPHRRVLLEDHHCVDDVEARNELEPLRGADDRPSGALQAAYRLVAVHADDEDVAERSRRAQAGEMAAVE